MKFGPAFWMGLFGYLSTIASVFVAQSLYGNWFLSIGLAAIWAILYVDQAARALTRLEMPIQQWRLLVRRFLRGIKVTATNANCEGDGALDGCPLYFMLVAKEGALSIRVCQVWFLRRNTIAVPWNQIEIRRVGTNSDGNYVATVSFPEFPDCELVLPWLRKFARFHDRAQPGSLPAERGPKTG